ncbi:MAG: alpha/beta hydrolase family protein [Alphaproteobacteria bacterium]
MLFSKSVRFVLFAVATVFGLLGVSPSPHASEAPFSSGITLDEFADTATGKTIPVAIFYPTNVLEQITKLGPVSLSVAMDAVPADGKHPFIVLSHGHKGAGLGHRTTATYLARRGYIVAAPTHPGDNYKDQSSIGTVDQFTGRPRHISLVIDGILNHQRLAKSVDRRQIGLIGFSAGGYGVLAAVGAKPDLNKWQPYCDDHEDDRVYCPAPVTDFPAQLPIKVDSRIGAIVAMSPGFGMLFDAEALSTITVPVRLYRAKKDRVNRVDLVRRFEQLLPADTTEKVVVENAGHFAFLSPCSKSQKARSLIICGDPEGFDRDSFQRRLNAEIDEFFTRTLRSR